MNNALSWWEKNRKWYTLVVVITMIAAIGYDKFVVSQDRISGIMTLDTIVINLIVWTFGANIFYSLGFGIEAVLNHYLKNPLGPGYRILALFSGTVFSILWTLTFFTMITV